MKSETKKTYFKVNVLGFLKLNKIYLRSAPKHLIQVDEPNFFVPFCSFFQCSLNVAHRGRQRNSGVDNEKALELTNSTVFYRGRQ